MSKKNDSDLIEDVAVDPAELIEQTIPPVDEEKKPEPKAGDPDYDWAPHYQTDGADLFRYTFPDGKVVAIRSFGSIYSKTFLYKLRKSQADVDIIFAAIDRAACPTAQALIEAVEAPLGGKDPIDDLWETWTKAGTAHVEGAEGLSTGE